MNDWLEITRDPPCPHSMRAIPNEENMFIWHLILTPPDRDHPLTGCNFHFLLEFPMNYPSAPPKVTGSQFMPHPNYFGGYVCLDMLVAGSWSSLWTGWSSAYTASAIMMQLQSFLFDEDVPQYGASKTNEITMPQLLQTYHQCITFECDTCGFNKLWKGFEIDHEKLGDEQVTSLILHNSHLKTPYDKIQKLPFMGPPDYGGGVDDPSKGKKKKTERIFNAANLTTIPDYTLLNIMDFLVRIEDISSAMRVCKRIQQVGEKFAVWTRRELICYHSKLSFLDDVLGVGIEVERGGKGNITTLSSPLDLLSRSAFFYEHVRKSPWRQLFHYWMPLIINEGHSQKGFPFLQATIVAMIHGISLDPPKALYDLPSLNNEKALEIEQSLLHLATKFQPLMVLDILPRLMNHNIVHMMDLAKQHIALHQSEKAILGYCAFHHMLLEMCRRFPNEIHKKIDHVLEMFAKHESGRVKLAAPDLGELLVYLSVSSKITWQHIGKVFVQELLDRNVVWMLDEKTGKGHGELAMLETYDVSNYRLSTTFESSLTGLRLLMFQVFFLAKVGRPEGSTPAQLLKKRNDSYGMPPPGTASLLLREGKEIMKVKDWPEFFSRIGLPCPSKAQMTTILRQAVINSERKGYHVNRLGTMELYQWRSRVDSEFIANAATKTENFPELRSKKKTNNNSENNNNNNNNQPASVEKIPELGNGHTTNPSKLDLGNGHTTSTHKPELGNGQTTNIKEEHARPVRPATAKIFVGNLSYRVTALDLEYVFQQFGKLVSSQVLYDENNRSRGFGFIEVENEDIANTVLECMQGADVDKRPVRLEKVDKNRPRTEKPYHKPAAPKQPPAQKPQEQKSQKSQKSQTNQKGEKEGKEKKEENKPKQQKEVKEVKQKAPKPQQQVNGKKSNAQQNPFAFLGDE